VQRGQLRYSTSGQQETNACQLKEPKQTDKCGQDVVGSEIMEAVHVDTITTAGKCKTKSSA